MLSILARGIVGPKTKPIGQGRLEMATAQQRSNKKHATNGINFIQNAFNDGAPNALLTMAHVQGAMINSIAQYNLEATRFFQRRMQKDIELATKMAKCGSITELQDASAEFCKTALEDYSEEMSTLANLYTGLTTETIKSVQNEAVAAETPAS